MALGVVYQDSEGSIISANPAAERILGLSLDQMKGRTSVDPSWKSLREDGSEFPGEEHPAMVALRTSEPVMNTTMGVFNPVDDSHKWISVTAIPLIQPGDDAPYLVYTTFMDITESKKLQEERIRQRSELELYASLLRHDFGNDLQIIIGLIEMLDLAQSYDIEGLEKILTTIKAASGRMNSLLTALGMLHGEKRETLSEMLTRVIDTATNVHQGLHIELEMPETIGSIDVGSYRLLETCCVNLLRNSAVHAGSNAHVHIQIQQENGFISLQFTDNGPGIDSSVMPNLFHRGTSTNGGGLGLYLAKQILETYGGTIMLEKSAPGEGASFLITLPISHL